MSILSIQSSVAFGHVGNAAATLPLQCLGHEVWPVPTVVFSNHPGYESWRGRTCPAEEVADLVDGIGERGAFADCDAVLSGYLGEPETGDVVLEAVTAVKRANPAALYCCDPVMGDTDRGFFVRPGIPEFFHERAVARADITLPNAFELAYLADRPVEDADGAQAAARILLDRGAGLVVVTGLRVADTVENLAVSAAGAWRSRTPWLDIPTRGAGDTFSALFLGHFLASRDAASALGTATAAMFAVMEATLAAGSRELQIVAARAAFTTPGGALPADRIG